MSINPTYCVLNKQVKQRLFYKDSFQAVFPNLPLSTSQISFCSFSSNHKRIFLRTHLKTSLKDFKDAAKTDCSLLLSGSDIIDNLLKLTSTDNDFDTNKNGVL